MLQGERHFARDNKSLGKFKLTGIRASFSSNHRIRVTFDIDERRGEGICQGRWHRPGTEHTITGSTNLSGENEISAPWQTLPPPDRPRTAAARAAGPA